MITELLKNYTLRFKSEVIKIKLYKYFHWQCISPAIPQSQKKRKRTHWDCIWCWNIFSINDLILGKILLWLLIQALYSRFTARVQPLNWLAWRTENDISNNLEIQLWEKNPKLGKRCFQRIQCIQNRHLACCYVSIILGLKSSFMRKRKLLKLQLKLYFSAF